MDNLNTSNACTKTFLTKTIIYSTKCNVIVLILEQSMASIEGYQKQTDNCNDAIKECERSIDEDRETIKKTAEYNKSPKARGHWPPAGCRPLKDNSRHGLYVRVNEM